MKITLRLLSVIAIVSTSYAGVIIEQSIEAGGEVKKTVMEIQDGLIRTDAGPEVTSIVDTATGEITTLTHSTKQVMKIKTPNAPDAPTPEAGPPDVPPMKFTDTGKTEKIDGHVCRIIKMEMGPATSTFWVAHDYPDYAKIQKEMAALNSLGTNQQTPPELKGMVLKTSTVASGYVAVTKIISVKIIDIDPARFKAPADYKEFNPGN